MALGPGSDHRCCDRTLAKTSAFIILRATQDQTMSVASAKVKERQRFVRVLMPRNESVVKNNPSSSLLAQRLVQVSFISWAIAYCRLISLVPNIATFMASSKSHLVEKTGYGFQEIRMDMELSLLLWVIQSTSKRHWLKALQIP